MLSGEHRNNSLLRDNVHGYINYADDRSGARRFADASRFPGVIRQLQSPGHTVVAPPNPLRSLAFDAAAIPAFAGGLGAPAVRVGHSYGGAVSTDACHDRDRPPCATCSAMRGGPNRHSTCRLPQTDGRPERVPPRSDHRQKEESTKGCEPITTDTRLQADVEDELKWDPRVTATEVGVAVNDGVVTLNGTVPTYAEKRAAEKAARRVFGVKAVAEEIRVEPSGAHGPSDTAIAEAAVRALQTPVWAPFGIQAIVEKGWVSLRGQVNWRYQKDAAFEAVRFLPGVVGVSNEITIEPTVEPGAVKQAIETALKRDAQIDAQGINVKADGGKVTLSGRVRSFAERDEVDWAAWSAPGVTEVKNDLSVV
jgi:osmotically-inducible protein OsmY